MPRCDYGDGLEFQIAKSDDYALNGDPENTPRWFRARMKGVCALCVGTVEPGEIIGRLRKAIKHEPSKGLIIEKAYVHKECYFLAYRNAEENG
jgi:hypothetical protein